MLASPSFLARHRHAVGQRRDLADDVGDRPAGLAGLARLDEPGVLGEPAGVEEERDREPVADRPDPAQVLEADRLPAAAVVRDRDEHDRDPLAAPLRDEPLEGGEVHVPLERVLERWLATLRDDQVDRLRAGELDVRPGRVEVGVVRDARPGLAIDREQDLLGRPALVGRDDVAEREQRLDRLEEREPRRRAGVRLVAALDRRPLVAATSRRSRSRSGGRSGRRRRGARTGCSRRPEPRRDARRRS